MNSTERTETVVRNYLTVGSRGDADALADLFAEDATWTLIGDLPISGTWRGRKQIFEDFRAQAFSRFDADTLKLAVVDVIASGDKAVLEWTAQADVPGGGQYDQSCIAIFTVHDDRITSVREYFDTDHARRVLFPA
ncbi:nuclear transport factor 2 family protein [Streptacidiphilus sp. P02-A3a]|uniref:nuclear transport factor 2 family protein n=1 Tax=Streptacidiphilus sp. P02-A3a TaxID=2704468 RepID=UPI0015FE5544|nr:nuclear transport factor 2 family protein [Streptacidiphilus sp. P02-A3a]QMU67144.1 nuclear transport factor 2 family protein [Streptacidiphilus sp. P02-A3a]